MNRQTRSKTVLPGSIRDYFLDPRIESSSTMPNEEVTPGVGNVEHEDIQSLMSMMVQTLAKVTEPRNVSPTVIQKLEDCPIKRKQSSLEAWIAEVLLWDESNVSQADGWNVKKYLKFVDSVRKSEDCQDLKNLVEVEFVENVSFEKKTDTIIKSMVEKIKEKLGQSDLEKCSDAWIEFINIKLEPTESAKSFLSRFEKVETQLRNVQINIPNKALAIHLLNKSSMLPQSKKMFSPKLILMITMKFIHP